MATEHGYSFYIPQLAHHQSAEDQEERSNGEASASAEGSAPWHGVPGGLARRLGHARCPCRGRVLAGSIGYDPLNPRRTPSAGPGQPYITRPCGRIYECPGTPETATP
ncbi:unnamed protein product [Urochloa decumbens]|uniref:Uncharacterized protein n=1 Tax=Urochloa decumbens TaxID=240449 RepID=A0ABC8WV16_9POAL